MASSGRVFSVAADGAHCTCEVVYGVEMLFVVEVFVRFEQEAMTSNQTDKLR